MAGLIRGEPEELPPEPPIGSFSGIPSGRHRKELIPLAAALHRSVQAGPSGKRCSARELVFMAA
jgi:hypothetical protein